MNHFTQKELLAEGFWNNFAKPLAKGALYVAKKAAPKTAAAISGVKEYGKGLKDALSSKEDLVKDALKKMGYEMVAGSLKPHPNAKGYDLVFASALTNVDPNGVPVPGKQETFLVDKDNNIITPSRRKK